MTFGYIARIVGCWRIEILTLFSMARNHTACKLFMVKSLTNITIPDNAPDIYENWTEIRLKYDIGNKTLHFHTPDTSISQHEC